ncbi:MAG: SAM-dependent methyltransferase [Candidatus Latescibacteria bacterium]|nr:SAM-dependent methyltransferase [bacterium]MCB9515598.1 SAM-dependent methyltransferase [Candidatus Latescibacterota bacterium]
MSSAEQLVARLLGPEGQALAAAVDALPAAERATPRAVAALRRLGDAELVALALRVAEAETRRPLKFPAAEPLRFTPELLEQASAHPVASHRAARLAPFGPVLDLGCGAGGDLTRLAAAGARVAGLEADPLAAALARANLAALGLEGEVVTGRHPGTPLPAHRALFLDPARRAAGPRGRRRRDPRAFSPSAAEVAALLRHSDAWCLKWGPALPLDDDELAGPDGPLAGLAPGDWELETVSWRGELREAVLWGGAARRGVTRQATLLDGDVERWATHAYRGDGRVPTPTPAPPGPWLHEPDPALIRAGLLDAFATEHGLAPVAPAIAYLTGDATRSPFLRRWPLLEQLPLSIPALQAALDRHDAGPLVLKKRGFPLDPETLRPRLRTGGKRPVTVLIYRDRRAPGGHEHQVCVCGEQAGE